MQVVALLVLLAQLAFTATSIQACSSAQFVRQTGRNLCAETATVILPTIQTLMHADGMEVIVVRIPALLGPKGLVAPTISLAETGFLQTLVA